MKPLPCKVQQSVRLNSKTLRCQAVSTAPVSMCILSHAASNGLTGHDLTTHKFRSPLEHTTSCPNQSLPKPSVLCSAILGL